MLFQLITFHSRIDSTVGNRQVDIKYEVRDFTNAESYNSAFPIYYIKNIYIYPDFVPKEALEKGVSIFQGYGYNLLQGILFC